MPEAAPEPETEPAESLDDDGTPGTGTVTPDDELVDEDDDEEAEPEEQEVDEEAE
jgi:hypothetical protein